MTNRTELILNKLKSKACLKQNIYTKLTDWLSVWGVNCVCSVACYDPLGRSDMI